MYYAYILKSLRDHGTYTGHSADVKERLLEHNAGKVKATKNRRPFSVLLVEEFKTLEKAKKREMYWKSGAGRRRLKNYFQNGFPPIQNFEWARLSPRLRLDGAGAPR